MAPETYHAIANNDRVTVIWRIFIAVMSFAGTTTVGVLVALMMSAGSKLQQQTTDMALIKQDLTSIRSSMLADKADAARQVDNLDKRMQSLAEVVNKQRDEMGSFRTDLELVKRGVQPAPR